jgi:UDP-3-O-[3-hydroxymyristoyl] glucosamine N-acyltransferase
LNWTLGTLAERLGCDFEGEAGRVLTHAASLESADPAALSFLVPGAARARLAATRAGAVLVAPADREAAPGAILLTDRPYLDYARAAQLLHPRRPPRPGIAAGAAVAASAHVAPDAEVAANAVVDEDAVVAAGSVIGAGAVLGRASEIGAGTRLGARTVVAEGCRIGQRGMVQPGAVIGSDGFGYAAADPGWVHIPQVGGVWIGDDVAIGANTTIDRGASDDTVIADGVILDNQIQIAHNVRIGAHTAMAGCVGVAGSAVVGERCTIAGAAVILGHLEVADDVHITALSLVSKSITLAGTYSSGVPLEPNADWRRNAARFRQLDRLARRVVALEKHQAGTQARGNRT